MKALLKIASLMMVTGFCTSALAQFAERKPVTHIDFNKMINDNNSTRAEIKKDIDAKTTAIEEDQVEVDRARVNDLVDIEVGWEADAPTVVDRRYNSVGAARPYNMNEENLQPQDGSGS